ncbi:MAG: NifU family protein [Armatimonadota bacterium]
MTNENNDLKKRVQEALEQIRPNLQADGGDVELVDVIDNIAHVKLTGACKGCPMAQMTLQMGVERVIKASVPEITGIHNVTTSCCE